MKAGEPKSGWKKYRNEEFGYEFNYPEGWKLKKITSKFVSISNQKGDAVWNFGWTVWTGGETEIVDFSQGKCNLVGVDELRQPNDCLITKSDVVEAILGEKVYRNNYLMRSSWRVDVPDQVLVLILEGFVLLDATREIKTA